MEWSNNLLMAVGFALFSYALSLIAISFYKEFWKKV